MTALPIEYAQGFGLRDNVYVAANPRPDSVHWIITGLNQAALGKVYATVRSPMSSRSRVVPIETLTLHSKAKEPKK